MVFSLFAEAFKQCVAEPSSSQAPSADGLISVDGHFGKRSTTALQALLQREGIETGPIDGYLGRRTIKAMQIYLERGGYSVGPIDGYCGWRTVKAMQKWLTDQGTNPGGVDGFWGYRTTCALQEVLNQQALPPNAQPVIFSQVVVATPSEDDPNQVPMGVSVQDDAEYVVVPGQPVTATAVR